MSPSPTCLRSAALAVLIASSGLAATRSVTVGWDPNPPDENVTGYLVYYGETCRAEPTFLDYQVEIDVGNVTEYTVELPDAEAVYCLAAKAYNAEGLRSDYSTELALGVKPATDVSASIAKEE